MMIFPAPELVEKFLRIEREEGVSPVELVHQAVTVWTTLTADERRELGFVAIQIVANRRFS